MTFKKIILTDLEDDDNPPIDNAVYLDSENTDIKAILRDGTVMQLSKFRTYKDESDIPENEKKNRIEFFYLCMEASYQNKEADDILYRHSLMVDDAIDDTAVASDVSRHVTIGVSIDVLGLMEQTVDEFLQDYSHYLWMKDRPDDHHVVWKLGYPDKNVYVAVLIVAEEPKAQDANECIPMLLWGATGLPKNESEWFDYDENGDFPYGEFRNAVVEAIARMDANSKRLEKKAETMRNRQ